MSASLLVPGVTRTRLDEVRARAWLGAAHAAARETGGRVLDGAEAPTAGRNWWRLRFCDREGYPLRLMLNDVADLVGCADDGDPANLVPAFRQVPGRAHFMAANFGVAQAHDLEKPLRESESGSLEPAELRDLAYHRPPRVGDVLFNWFD
jgi:hypothetical protein